MSELEHLLEDGHYLELSKDGDTYVVKLFKKNRELAVTHGRGDSLAEAVWSLTEKQR